MVLIYSDKDGKQHKMNIKGRIYLSNSMHDGNVMEIALEETTSFSTKTGQYETDGGFDMFSTSLGYDIAVSSGKRSDLHIMPIRK